VVDTASRVGKEKGGPPGPPFFPVEVTVTVKNIREVIAQATEEELQTGKDWYTEANKLASSWADQYDLPIDAVVGVIGALSPCVPWTRNIEDAKAILDAHAEGQDPRIITVSTFGPNKEKAARILEEGTRHGIIGGQKVIDFCDQIEDPSRGIAVIDRHAMNVWIGERVVFKGSISKGRYLSAQEDYEAAAKMCGMTPDQAQATAWVVWRRMHGVR